MNQPATNSSSIGNIDLVIKGGAQTRPGQPAAPDGAANRPNKVRRGKGHDCIYRPVPLWNNLLYGIGAVVVIAGPMLIPGVSERGLVMGYMGAIIGFYLAVCSWGMVRNLRSTERRH